ncbi:hypothetical protein [Sporisorium scitamineum]|uniref:Uncharacterized protein n=1 Tax=Sporisorium scitamineum TaxID=49012 RepID=A0A0F7S8B6_9BASI|nr:hypothetical protein [Sporisorium scitamineum]
MAISATPNMASLHSPPHRPQRSVIFPPSRQHLDLKSHATLSHFRQQQALSV